MDEGEFACPLGPTVRLTARPPERLFHLVLESHDGRAPSADSEEKHEPASDIDTVVVDSLKALDPEWPIREADIARRHRHVRFVPQAVVSRCNNVKPKITRSPRRRGRVA